MKQLSKYIRVDVYGNCGRPCGDLTATEGNCYAEIGSKYKFYLSFENSICPEYITEKFFLAMENSMIPVVYGGANYSEVAPPHSYIPVNNFRSPKVLAEYLHFLDTNEDEYLKYFEWRNNFKVAFASGWCTLSKMVAQVDQNMKKGMAPLKVYTDLAGWWENVPSHKYQCRR